MTGPNAQLRHCWAHVDGREDDAAEDVAYPSLRRYGSTPLELR